MSNSILGGNFLGGNDVPDSTPMVPGTAPLPAGLTAGATIAAPEKDEDQGPNTVGPDWVDQLAGAFVHTTATAASRPGSFASKLNGALSRIGADLGIPAMQARQDQMQKQKQQDFENKLATNRDLREQKDLEMRSALNAIQVSVEAERLKKEKQEFSDLAYNAGKTAAAERDKSQTGETLTENEIKKRMDAWESDPANSAKSHWAQTHDMILVGHENINGRDVSTYKVYPKTNEMTPISEPERKFINDYYGNAQTIPEGTQLRTEDVQAMHLKAVATQQSLAKLEEANGEKLMPEQTRQMAQDLSTPIVRQALSADPGDTIRGFEAVRSQNAAFIQQMTHLQELLSSHADPKKIQALQQKMQNSKDPQERKEAQELLTVMAGLQKRDPQAIQAAQKEVADHLAAAQKDEASLKNVANFGFSEKAKADYRADIKEADTARHQAAEEAIQNRRADIAAQKAEKDANLASSYKIENGEFDKVRVPLQDQLKTFATLRATLDQGTGVGDSTVAPQLLKTIAGGKGSGVRITQAEISQFIHGRSTIEDMKGILNKMVNGKTITNEQRRQVYDLLGVVESKAQQKAAALEAAQDSLDTADTVLGQRQVVSGLNKQLDQIDGLGSTQAPAAKPPAPAAASHNQFAGKFGVTAGGKTHYFNTQAEANKFQQSVDAATGVNRQAVGNFIKGR